MKTILLVTIVLLELLIIQSSFILVKGTSVKSQDFGNTEIFPTASVGNKTLGITLRPYSSSSISGNQIHYIEFRIFDTHTNQTIPRVSFFVNMTNENKPLLNDLFYTSNGTLTLQITPDSTNGRRFVNDTTEPLLGGWEPSKDNKFVIVNTPFFGDNATFHISIEIFSLGAEQGVFNHANSPKFESFLNLKEQNNSIILMKQFVKINDHFQQIYELRRNIPTPLKQFNSGIKIKDIVCTTGYVLLVKADNDSPACVTSHTADMLIERGWGVVANSTIMQASNSPQALQVNLSLNATTVRSGQSIGIDISLSNAFSTTLNLQRQHDWAIDGLGLAPCQYFMPLGISILDGYYTAENMTIGKQLALYPNTYTCAMVPVTSFSFQPMSDHALIICNLSHCGESEMKFHLSYNGFFDKDYHYHALNPGSYTIIGGDEWRHFEIRHFVVTN